MADTPGAAEGQRESARGKRENRKGRFLGFSAQKRCLCTSQSQTAQSLGVIGRQTQMPRAGGKKTSILTVGKEGVLASTELPENEVGAHMCPAGGPGALAELQGRRPLLWPARAGSSAEARIQDTGSLFVFRGDQMYERRKGLLVATARKTRRAAAMEARADGGQGESSLRLTRTHNTSRRRPSAQVCATGGRCGPNSLWDLAEDQDTFQGPRWPKSSMPFLKPRPWRHIPEILPPVKAQFGEGLE